MSAPQNTIAFIGLGLMGYPMAVNLRTKIGKETAILICDTNIEALNRFQTETGSHGPIEVVENAYEAVKRANVLFSVMPSNDAVKAVFLESSSGALAGAAADPGQQKLLVECGTVSQATIFEVADAASEVENVTFVDAPISGGPARSKAGTLSFMVGCDDSKFEHLRSFLLHMGKPETIFHCGKVGAGSASKIINNYISLITVLSVSEAYNIAEKMGMDLKVLTNIFNASSAQCWVTSTNNPVPGIQPDSVASRQYEGGFRIELALKDLGLGRELAQMVGARAALNESALGVYREAAGDARYAGKDCRILYKFLGEN